MNKHDRDNLAFLMVISPEGCGERLAWALLVFVAGLALLTKVI